MSEGSNPGRAVNSRKSSRNGVKHATVTKTVTFCGAACSGVAFRSTVDGLRLLHGVLLSTANPRGLWERRGL